MSGLIVDARIEREGFDVDAELCIEPGETVAVVGPNGAGKSTLARAVTGLLPISSGEISLDDRQLDAPARSAFVPPHEREIGTCFQESLLFPHLDVGENVGFRGAARGRSVVAGEVDGWLARVGLDGFSSRDVRGLSGGQARRVAIARALFGDPALVVLDEPFAGLDVEVAVAVRRMLGELLANLDVPCLLITHDPIDAQALADRVVVLEHGRVTQTGTPDEVRQRPATAFVAKLVGTNLVSGVATAGEVRVADDLVLTTVDQTLTGPCSVTISPSAVSLHRDRPAGSQRNAWQATVAGVHGVGDVVRVHFDVPIPMIVDVTPGAVRDLEIEAGSVVWAAVKATSLAVR